MCALAASSCITVLRFCDTASASQRHTFVTDCSGRNRDVHGNEEDGNRGFSRYSGLDLAALADIFSAVHACQVYRAVICTSLSYLVIRLDGE